MFFLDGYFVATRQKSTPWWFHECCSNAESLVFEISLFPAFFEIVVTFKVLISSFCRGKSLNILQIVQCSMGIRVEASSCKVFSFAAEERNTSTFVARFRLGN